jgi:hypothetical protein
LRGRSIVFTRQRHRSTVPAITPSSRRHPQRPSHAPFCPLPHATTIAPSSLWKWTGSRPSPGWSSWRRPTEQTLSTRPSCAPVVLIDRFVCVCTAIYRFAQHIAANGHPLANAHDVFKHAAHLARCLRTRMARSLSTASPPPPPSSPISHHHHTTTTSSTTTNLLFLRKITPVVLQISCELPTLLERKQLFELHIKPLFLAPNVKADDVIPQLAALTPGMSGAQIASVCNEAALIAARRGGESVSVRDFWDAADRVIAGPEKRTRTIREGERRVVAYHETGHVLTAW